MKRWLKPLLAALIVMLAIVPMGVLAATTDSDTCGDNLTWTLDSDGVLTISGTGEMYSYYFDEPPWASNRSKITRVVIENGVTNISDKAFQNCENLTSITIPNSVTCIDLYAFCNCPSLTSVSIPDSVTVIYDGAFAGTGLTSVTIPDSVTYLSGFTGCENIANVTIPGSVKYIGANAFYGCTGLTSVTIPNSVSSINESAFNGCTGLTSVIIPGSVTEIANSVFKNCTGLTNMTIPNSVTEIGHSAFAGCTGLTSVTISNSVTEIDHSTFMDCTNLTSVIIPNSVTSIGDNIFKNCARLTDVTIGNALSSIRAGAFDNCVSIQAFTVDQGNTAFSNDNYGALYNKNKTTLLYYPADNAQTAYVVPSSVTSIEYSAFMDGCTDLTSVIIPRSVTEIGVGAFAACSSLTDVYYAGSEDEWKAITIGINNYPLTSATIHYNADSSGSGLTAHSHPLCGEATCTGHGEGYEPHTEATAYTTQWSGEVDPTDVTGNIVLTGHTTLTAVWEITGDVNLCLNGKTLNVDEKQIQVATNGVLNVCDCAGGGKITSINTDSGTYTSTVRVKSGNFSLYSGEMTCISGGDVIHNEKNGSISVFGGMVSCSAGYASSIQNYGTCTIIDGTVSAQKESTTPIEHYEGTLTIKGGTISKTNSSEWGSYTCILSDTYMVDNVNIVILISGGTFYGDLYICSGASRTSCTLDVRGGTIYGTLLADNDCITRIDDVTIISSESCAISNSSSNMTINGGTFTSTDNTDGAAMAVQNAYGTLKINGGSFHSEHGPAIDHYGSGTLYLSGTPKMTSGHDATIELHDETAILYGFGEDGMPYTGDPVTISYSDVYPSDGQPVVYKSTDTTRFSMFESDKYTLAPGTDEENKNHLVLVSAPTHDHDWAEDWTYNGTHHWHNCTADDCSLTQENQTSLKDGYGTHSYSQRVTDAAYLKSAATCNQAAVYYYSCVCGKVGTETFTSGSATGQHSGGTATCQQKAMCSSCNQLYGDVAAHSYTSQAVLDTYLVTPATCTTQAVYCYSCEWCGEKGSETFSYGDLAAHTGGSATCTQKAVCDVCKQGYGEKAAHTEVTDAAVPATCAAPGLTEGKHCSVCKTVLIQQEVVPVLDHTYDQEEVEDTYLKSAATCTSGAIYYKSCTCGEKGTETFIFGSPIAHTYDKEVVDEKYAKTAASCASPGVYYKSCVCGAKGTATFTYGSATGHNYTRQSTDAAYLKSKATCTAPAVYYKSCTCGAKGTTTFSYGNANGHQNAYFASGNVLTVKCGVCKTSATATIQAPANLKYDGKAKKATVTYSGSWPGSTLTIVYASGTGTLTGAPTAVGTYTATITADDAKASVTFTIVKEDEAKQPFKDVPPSSPYYDAVMWALENDVTAGVGGGYFGVGSTCTRGEVMTFLYAAKDRPGADLTKLAKFKDVAKIDWFAEPVAWALANKVTAGTSDITFGPYDTCTTAQVITFLWAAMGRETPEKLYSFADLPLDNWYVTPISWAVENKLIQKDVQGNIGAYDPCPRENIVLYLYRFLGE